MTLWIRNWGGAHLGGFLPASGARKSFGGFSCRTSEWFATAPSTFPRLRGWWEAGLSGGWRPHTCTGVLHVGPCTGCTARGALHGASCTSSFADTHMLPKTVPGARGGSFSGCIFFSENKSEAWRRWSLRLPPAPRVPPFNAVTDGAHWTARRSFSRTAGDLGNSRQTAVEYFESCSSKGLGVRNQAGRTSLRPPPDFAAPANTSKH